MFMVSTETVFSGIYLKNWRDNVKEKQELFSENGPLSLKRKKEEDILVFREFLFFFYRVHQVYPGILVSPYAAEYNKNITRAGGKRV